MYRIKKLIILSIFLAFSFGGDVTYRGMVKEEILRSSVPISFMHQVIQNYDLLPQQLSPVRGGYLMIAIEGLVQQGYLDIFIEFKKTTFRND